MQAEIPESSPFGRGKFLGTALGVLALPALWFAPIPLDPGAQHALAISALMVVFWIVEPIPHAMTGLLGCWLFWALGVVRSWTRHKNSIYFFNSPLRYVMPS